MAPHFAEEQWEKLGNTQSIYLETWPILKEEELKGGIIKIPVQVNGKLKTVVEVEENLTQEEILKTIKADEKVKEILNNNTIKKEIYVPKKIFNLVVYKGENQWDFLINYKKE